MSIKKTFLKTLSYGVMHVCNAVLVAYALSRSWRVAFAIGTVEPCVQTIAFFFHEKAWHKIESREHKEDYHDSVIDGSTPAASWIESLLRRKH